ncbi:MAG: hypothetical protein ACO4AU_11890 [bacterium]
MSYAPDAEHLGWDVFGMSWDLASGSRLALRTTRREQRETVWRLLLGKLKPKRGSLSYAPRVLHQGDEEIWKRARPEASLEDNLHSRLFEVRPWWKSKRHDQVALMHQLELPVSVRKLPLRSLKPEMSARALMLLMICAKAHVFVLRQIPGVEDPMTQQVFSGWFHSFSGALLLLDPPERWWRVCDTTCVLDSSGTAFPLNTS